MKYFTQDERGELVNISKQSIPPQFLISLNEANLWRVSSKGVTIALYDIEGKPAFFISYPREHWRIKEILKNYKKIRGFTEKPRFLIDGVSPLEKSLQLLKEVVGNNSERMSLEGEFLRVKSRNKDYLVSLKNGKVYGEDGNAICVCVHEWTNLPIYDIVLAKALAIAFTPNEIHTLE